MQHPGKYHNALGARSMYLPGSVFFNVLCVPHFAPGHVFK